MVHHNIVIFTLDMMMRNMKIFVLWHILQDVKNILSIKQLSFSLKNIQNGMENVSKNDVPGDVFVFLTLVFEAPLCA